MNLPHSPVFTHPMAWQHPWQQRTIHGNAYGEQNHWSVLPFLNPGVAEGGNTYCEHSRQVIKDLL